MLKILRNKRTAKKIWIALAIVVIIAFVFGFGGISSTLRSRRKPVFFGKVFGKSISTQEYLRNYRAVRNQYLIRLGEDELAKLEKYLNLQAQVWDRIVLLAEAKRKRIRVSNSEVVDWIKHFPFFQREGRFNPELYQEILTYVFRTSPRAFEEEIRDSLTIAKLYSRVTGGITVNDDEIRDAYEKTNQQISLDYVSVSFEDFLNNDISVEEQELLDYYNKNSEQFKKPLSYNLEYIRVEDEQKIKKITQLLNQKFSLRDIAKDTGLEVKETGLFSSNEPIPQIGWSTEISRILTRLKPKGNAWPQPIRTDTDIIYFIGLKEKNEPYIQSFDDVKNEVTQRLRQQKASQIAQEKLNACRRETEVVGFVKAAKKFNLKIGKTELFKPQGYVEALGDSNIFFEAVQNLREGQISQVLGTPSGYFVVKLRQRIEPSEEEFKKEKTDFAKSLLEMKKQDHFRQFLTEIKNRPDTFSTSLMQISP
jgi:hypothetical protein